MTFQTSKSGVNVKVSPTGSDSSEVTYQGPQTLVFGFKVYGISYANGAWAIHGQEPSGGNAYMTAHEAKGIVLANDQLMPSIPAPSADKTNPPQRDSRSLADGYGDDGVDCHSNGVVANSFLRVTLNTFCVSADTFVFYLTQRSC